jgi:peptidoglycan/xylan/chitin deacetylase (PgdA/CDA1 family)
MLVERVKRLGSPILSLAGRIVWRMPFSFGVATLLGPTYALRCLLFHDIADHASEFTEGLGVTLSRKRFEDQISFVSKYYTPVTLQEVLAGSWEKRSDKPRILVTFDDAYFSAVQVAAPILRQYGVPAVMFVTGSLIGNHVLGLDNLLCYVVNRHGLEVVHSVACEISRRKDLNFLSCTQVTNEFLPTLSQSSIAEFHAALVSAIRIPAEEAARRAQIYLSADQLRSLVADGFEIGNHTYSHVFCRSLRASEFHHEIYANKTRLEAITGSKVRAFSVPYGSPKDLTPEVERHLRCSGHEAAFLVDNRMNTPTTDRYRLSRISLEGESDADLFTKVEMLPRLQSLRDEVVRASGRYFPNAARES